MQEPANKQASTNETTNRLKNSINILASKKRTRSLCIMSVILYFLIIIIYCIVAKEYSYYVIKFNYSFSVFKFIIATFLLILLLLASYRIKEKIQLFIYFLFLILLFMGEAVCFIFCNDANPATLIGTCALLAFFVLLQNTHIQLKNNTIKKDPMPLLLVIALILFIPFVITYYNKINIKNIFLSDIYETRVYFREKENQNVILGYISAPLSRIILPALIALSINNKRKSYLIICSVMIIFIFLCGALKSILFGLFAVLLFYGKDYYSKTKRIMIILITVLSIGILTYPLFGNNEIINLSRRVFFVPARLNSMYANYFQGKPDYLSHSPLGLGLTENEYGDSLSMYFGTEVMGTSGMNANVGLIAEGFISFNYVGLFIFALLTAVIFQFFRWVHFDAIFGGIIVVYIYYTNTAFISTLLLTHGLLFLLLFSYLFLRNTKWNKRYEYC